MALYGPGGYITGTESSADTGVLDPIVRFTGQSYVVTISWNPNSAGGPYEIRLRPSEMELLQDGVTQEACSITTITAAVTIFEEKKVTRSG